MIKAFYPEAKTNLLVSLAVLSLLVGCSFHSAQLRFIQGLIFENKISQDPGWELEFRGAVSVVFPVKSDQGVKFFNTGISVIFDGWNIRRITTKQLDIEITFSADFGTLTLATEGSKETIDCDPWKQLLPASGTKYNDAKNSFDYLQVCRSDDSIHRNFIEVREGKIRLIKGFFSINDEPLLLRSKTG